MRTEDGHIIQQCLDGDHVAFGLLVDKYKRSVYAIAYSRLRNCHDAQDITQEVFIKAYQNLHTLRRWDNFMGWLYRVTTNLCKDWLRLKAMSVDKDYVEDQKTNTLDQISMDSYEENALYESINDSLESLPDIYQEILSLRYFGGMNIHEISIFLGMSTRTIDRRLKEAMSILKEETLTMITAAKEQHQLPGSFTFRILELIKHIRINPSPSLKMIPWGISMATGLIIAVLGFGMRFNITNNIDYATISSSTGEPEVLDVGEFPVDVMKVSDVSVISSQQISGDGSGAMVPDLQNALFMEPQAEGGTWTKKTDMLTARFLMATSEVNDKIYAIGGSIINANGRLQDLQIVEEYDPSLDKWTRKASMPTPRSTFSTSVVDGKIYAIGGDIAVRERACAIVEEYDPSLDKWARKASMPTARAGLSTCTVNGKIYAIGGSRWDDANAKLDIFSVVEEYDPKTNIWTKKADMPTKRGFFASSASAVNGLIYVIGGGDEKGIMLSIVEEYDPILDKWTKKADMPTARVTSIAAANGKIYAIGGYEGNNKPVLSTVEEYDPVTDSWTKKNDMPTARTNLATCAVNGKIYAIGGDIGQKEIIPTAIIEEYDPGMGQSINFKGKLPTTWGDARTAMNKKINRE